MNSFDVNFDGKTAIIERLEKAGFEEVEFSASVNEVTAQKDGKSFTYVIDFDLDWDYIIGFSLHIV